MVSQGVQRKPSKEVYMSGSRIKDHKRIGPKRPTYQSPWAEHPETNRMIAESDIHANHAEAFWSALRRKCATFRRKTNMYAKTTAGLQRLLHGRSYGFGDWAKTNKASKRPLTQASLRCKRWLKPSSLQRIPTPLNRC